MNRRRNWILSFGVLTAVAVFAAIVPSTAYAASGDLDATFGTGGTSAVSPVNPGWSSAPAALQPLPGGAMLIGGTFEDRAGVVKLLPSGQVDESFGTRGKTLISFVAGYADSLAQAIAIDSRGRIVLSGSMNANPAVRNDVMVLRLLGNGSPDPSFNHGHPVVIPGTFPQIGKALTIAKDDSIFVSGNDIFHIRENGALDAHWGTSGRCVLEHPAGAAFVPSATALDPAGRLLVVGVPAEIFVTRLNSNCSVDTTFGTHGFLALPHMRQPSVRSIARTADGFVFGGQNLEAAWLAKISLTGDFDATFGTAGFMQLPQALLPDTELVSGLSAGVDGSVLIGGITNESGTPAGKFFVVRVTPSGQLDTSMGVAGLTVLDLPSPLALSASLSSRASAMTQDPEGRVVLTSVGSVTVNSFWAISQRIEYSTPAFELAPFATSRQLASTGATPLGNLLLLAFSLILFVSGVFLSRKTHRS